MRHARLAQRGMANDYVEPGIASGVVVPGHRELTAREPQTNGSVILAPMKILRTFLVLLLCAVLPLTGLAASGSAGQCPMQMIMADNMGSAMQCGMPGCDTTKRVSDVKVKGSSCKVSTQCQLGNLYHPVSFPVVLRPAGRYSPVVFHYVQSLPVREPDGPWRPPRAL